MPLGNQIPDKTLLKNVQRKLMQKYSGATRVQATVQSGSATVTGTIRHEHERRPIIRCVAAVQGIRNVIDQLRICDQKKPTS